MATGAQTLPSLHVVQYQLVVARRSWRSILVTGFATPVLYILALGVGLGSVVNRHSGGALGVPYVVFVAPAFLTATALQIGANEAAFPVMSAFKWQRVYHGVVTTPLTPAHVADGVLLWISIRLLANSAVYFAIMAAFGAVRTPWASLAIGVATLTGCAFAAPVAAVSATINDEGTFFNVIFRFVVTPMFLFSGTFYPISQLPQWGQVLAWLSPLWHGTELARDAALGGGLSVAAVAGHLLYLLAWLSVGVALARWRFRVRLTR